MYDTIIFLIHKKDIGDSHKWQAVLLNIFQTCEYKQVAGGCGYTGGLRISVTENRVRIEGSLSKYYYGNNTQTLTLAHAKEAIKRLGRQFMTRGKNPGRGAIVALSEKDALCRREKIKIY